MKGSYSIANSGAEKTSKNAATTKSGTNSARMPGMTTAPRAVSGGTARRPS